MAGRVEIRRKLILNIESTVKYLELLILKSWTYTNNKLSSFRNKMLKALHRNAQTPLGGIWAPSFKVDNSQELLRLLPRPVKTLAK